MSATRITAINSDAIKTLLAGKKIAIFAATLNPPTVGHDELIDQLLAQKNDEGVPNYDFVYIHTTENSPTGHYKPDTGDYVLRHAMTKAAFEGKERVLLSDIHPLETVSWLMHVPGIEVCHVIGADSMAWLQGASDRGEAVFFKGTIGNRPTATVQHPKTGEPCLFSGRGIYEIRTSRLVITQRADAESPAVFLGIPTENLELVANTAHGQRMSSSTIRNLIKAGSLAEAMPFLAPGLLSVFAESYAYLYR